jgi:hypothetical protein
LNSAVSRAEKHRAAICPASGIGPAHRIPLP